MFLNVAINLTYNRILKMRSYKLAIALFFERSY